jgi:hypothetical protein
MGSGEWVSLHVFYSADVDPMIVETLRPLVARLREDGLVEGWFFIKYWKGGPHLRLRLKPASAEVREEVTTRAVDAIQEFLARRPALFDIYTDAESRGRIYKKMYVAEYGAESWNQEYGVAGQMPFEPNNSIAVLPYEPEYDRYGGEVGVQIAEWHFEQTSDLTAHLLAVSNTHVRPALLGLATQLMLMSAYTFLGEDAAVRRFFQRYRAFWETAYDEPTAERHAVFDRSFEMTRETFEARLARIRTLAKDGTEQPSGIERAWLTHSRDLRDRVRTAADQGELVFRSPAGGEPAPVPYGERLITVLLSSYVHMTNNRLGTSPGQEAYLSYLIERALEPGAVAARSG